MEIINLERLVFEGVNGPEGHLCSLNFFQKALHIHSKSLQKNFWSAPCSLEIMMEKQNKNNKVFFFLVLFAINGLFAFHKWSGSTIAFGLKTEESCESSVYVLEGKECVGKSCIFNCFCSIIPKL